MSTALLVEGDLRASLVLPRDKAGHVLVSDIFEELQVRRIVVVVVPSRRPHHSTTTAKNTVHRGSDVIFWTDYN